MSHRTWKDCSTLFTPPFLRNSSFAYPLPVSNELSSLRSTSPLPNYTQIVGRLVGHSPSYVTTSAICRQWTYSFIFSKPKAQVKSCGWVLMGLLGEYCWPSSSNRTRASRVSSSRFVATKMIQPFPMGFPYTGHINLGSRNPDALKTYPHGNERCVTSSPTSK